MEVLAFGAVAFEPELQEIAGLFDAAKAYVIVAIDPCDAALFDLFEVARVVWSVLFVPMEKAVSKVDEQFAAVQVVGREW